MVRKNQLKILSVLLYHKNFTTYLESFHNGHNFTLKNNLVTPNLDQAIFSGCNPLYHPFWSAKLKFPTAWWLLLHRCAIWTLSWTFGKLKTDQICSSSWVPSVMSPASSQSPRLELQESKKFSLTHTNLVAKALQLCFCDICHIHLLLSPASATARIQPLTLSFFSSCC